MVVADRVKHGEALFAYFDAQYVTSLHVDEYLSVETCHGAAGFVYLNVNLRVRAEHDRAVGEGVRRNWHQEHAGNGRMHDGTARGHRVGGRSGRGAHQNAVGALHCHLETVNVDGVLDHTQSAAVADTDVVDGQSLKEHITFAPDAAFEHAALVGDVFL